MVNRDLRDAPSWYLRTAWDAARDGRSGTRRWHSSTLGLATNAVQPGRVPTQYSGDASGQSAGINHSRSGWARSCEVIVDAMCLHRLDAAWS